MYLPKAQPLQRIVVYPKDVVNITGRSLSSARRLLQNIRLANNMSYDQFVTVKEFCAFTGMEMRVVEGYLKY